MALGGRRPTDESGIQKKRSVLLTDLEVSRIVERYGSLSGGVRQMYRELFANDSERKTEEKSPRQIDSEQSGV